MVHINRDNAAVNKPSLEMVDFSNLPVSTASEIDTAILENAINDMQKIASYVDEKALSQVSMTPQLTVPGVPIRGEENDASSLEELLAALRSAKKDNTIDSKSLLSRLAKIVDNALTDPIELEKSWTVFKEAYDKLLNAQAEVEKVILMLVEFRAIPEPTQDDIDKMTKIANEAFANVNAAMAELIVTVKAVLISADQEHLNLIEEVQAKLVTLEYIMVQLQKNMTASKISVIKNQSELFQMQQKDLQAQLITKAEQIKEAQNKRATFVDAMKYVLMGLAVILSFASGGTFGILAGMVSAALLVLDLATQGKVSEVLMAPITAILMPVIEGIVTGISKAMKAAGCNEIASLVMGVVVAIVTVVALAVVVGKVAGKIVGKLADKFMPLFEKVFEKVADVAAKVAAKILEKMPFLKTIFDFVSKVVGHIVDFVQMIWNKVIDIIQTAASPVFNLLGKLLEPVIDLIKSAINYFSDLLASLGGGGDGILASVGKYLDDLLESAQQWLEPIFTKIQEMLKRVDKFMDDALNDALNYLFDDGYLDQTLKNSMEWLDEMLPAEKAIATLADQVLDSQKKEVYLNFLKALQNFLTLAGTSVESGLTVASSKAEQDGKKMQADSVLINAELDIVTRQISSTTELWGKQLPIINNFYKLTSSLVQSQQQAVAVMYRNILA